MSEEELIATVRLLSGPRLHRWIRLGWVQPERRAGEAVFHEIDVARVQLLQVMEHELEFDEDTIPLLLSLLDQIHGLRSGFMALAAAVDEQSPETRERIRAAFRRLAGD